MQNPIMGESWGAHNESKTKWMSHGGEDVLAAVQDKGLGRVAGGANAGVPQRFAGGGVVGHKILAVAAEEQASGSRQYSGASGDFMAPRGLPVR